MPRANDKAALIREGAEHGEMFINLTFRIWGDMNYNM